MRTKNPKALKAVAKPLTKKLKEVAKLHLYGGQMANLLYSIKTRPEIPADVRQKAAELQDKWDAISPHRNLGPIAVIELEKLLQ